MKVGLVFLPLLFGAPGSGERPGGTFLGRPSGRGSIVAAQLTGSTDITALRQLEEARERERSRSDGGPRWVVPAHPKPGFPALKRFRRKRPVSATRTGSVSAAPVRTGTGPAVAVGVVGGARAPVGGEDGYQMGVLPLFEEGVDGTVTFGGRGPEQDDFLRKQAYMRALEQNGYYKGKGGCFRGVGRFFFPPRTRSSRLPTIGCCSDQVIVLPCHKSVHICLLKLQ